MPARRDHRLSQGGRRGVRRSRRLPSRLLTVPSIAARDLSTKVQSHETVGEIAEIYGVDAADIAAFRPNNLRALQPCAGSPPPGTTLPSLMHYDERWRYGSTEASVNAAGDLFAEINEFLLREQANAMIRASLRMAPTRQSPPREPPADTTLS